MESKCPLWILAPIFSIKYQRHSSLSGIETKSNMKRPKGCGLTIWFPVPETNDPWGCWGWGSNGKAESLVDHSPCQHHGIAESAW